MSLRITYSPFKGEPRSTANKFEFPGGKIKANETQTDGLIRELKEELDLDVRVGEWITTVEHCYKDFSIMMHCYLVHLESFIGLLNEHVRYFHGSLEEAKRLDWIEADKPILDILETNYRHIFS